MADGIDDQRSTAGQREADGGAAKQDSTRADSDRGYGARDGQRESGRDDDPDRGAKDAGSASGGAARPDQRTDAFGGRSDQPGDPKAGWRSVGAANPHGLIGGEDEKPGDGDPLGNGVR